MDKMFFNTGSREVKLSLAEPLLREDAPSWIKQE
jgi:molybdenum cofactor biosynthesis enzyme MoaA